MDCVIPYKTSFSDEIKYCLRSLKNVPHGEVFVIGDKPKLNVKHIAYEQTVDIASNTLNIINLAVESEDISEDFIYIHDDMYILNPIKRIPVHHRGLYKAIIGSYERRGVNNFYVQRMRKTYNKLLMLGIKEPICYELHIPFVINKTKWRNVAQHITPSLNKLSMYGNLNHIGGSYIQDVKVRTRDWMPQGNFVSTHDTTFNVNRAGRKIAELFYEKSEYEL